MARATEAERRDDLVQATIHEIGASGSLDVTVGQIAKRAGVSPALAFHYFGGKDRLFLAAMRSILSVYGAEVRGALMTSNDPRTRVELTIRASFAPSNFRSEVVSAWLNFYVMAATDPEAQRLLTVYQRRLHSNLVHALRPIADAAAYGVADRIAGLIDGLYLRAALEKSQSDGARMADHVLTALKHELQALPQ